MIRLNTDQMRQRLSESYDFIYLVEQQKTEKQKEQNNERAKDTQVSNG